MAIARDWLGTLWAASYKGVPFFVEKDNESGSRRIVEHEFPMRDTPYLEDLGEGVRHFQVTAYVASDAADNQASSVMQICATRGPGVLVLPTHGPTLVRCLEFERDRSKDKHGYIAHSLKFSREGASGALASVAMLANLVFVEADNLAIGVAAAFANSVQLVNQADFVFAEASDGLQNAVALIDSVRTTEPTDPAISAAQRDVLQITFNDIPQLLEDADTVQTAPLAIVSAARAVADGILPELARRAFEAIIADPTMTLTIASTYPTPRQHTAAINRAEALRVARLAALAAYCEAVVRVPLKDRPQAISLRADVADFLETELGITSANEHGLYRAIGAIRDRVIDYLSRSIIDLAPVIIVNANLSMPSLYWAWRIYADPLRSTEIADRNRVAHPSFIPPTFEALSK